MRKVIFNQAHRKIYGEKSIDFSLLAIGGLIFGQFLSAKGLSLPLVTLGFILFLLGVILSYLFLKGNKGGDKNDS